MRRGGPVTTDIVLVGGGHAHVHVLTAFAKRRVPGVRLTLVSRDLETPYSGMLPGLVAGIYSHDEAHIDLARLAAATGTRLIHAAACGLDRFARRVLLQDRPPLGYDILSIDVGITPALDAIDGAVEHGIAVKPIGRFVDKLDALLVRCREADGPRRIAVVGGGAGGVELLLSLLTRIRAEATAAGLDTERFSFLLVTAETLLATHDRRVQDAFRRVLRERSVELRERSPVAALGEGSIILEGGAIIAADAVLVTTNAAPPAWFAGTGLALDTGGFIAVRPTLQALNDPNVFAAGDCAGLVETPREKAGVYAVRAGPPLARNLAALATGAEPRPWRPQRRHLALISTGERYAVASRGGIKAEGAWLWRLKDLIDRRWMRMYQDAEGMVARMARAAPPVVPPAPDEMRCGGCAAKVGPGPLSAALSRLSPAPPDASVLVGLGAPDDAAVIAPPVGANLVQTVDFFRAFIDDPFTLGEIAAGHALNDIFAMGGRPRHALATAVVPPGAARVVEEDLYQLLAGARRCLDREGVTLVGGHSSEGEELAIGFAVTGEVAPERMVRKAGLKEGDALVLTRPLGTAIVFAGLMRGKARAASVAAALSSMRRSNRSAAEILIDHGASAMTDVTGFGLAGHLGEMLAASGASASIDPGTLPLYPGVRQLAEAGVVSSLLADNLALRRLVEGEADAATLAILFDPQTAGGLLAGVPAARAEACVDELRQAGHAEAAVVGRIIGGGLAANEVRIRLVP